MTPTDCTLRVSEAAALIGRAGSDLDTETLAVLRKLVAELDDWQFDHLVEALDHPDESARVKRTIDSLDDLTKAVQLRPRV